jgi:hypothetical protein
MRYSLRGNLRVEDLEGIMRQWVADLVDHHIDEVSGLSLYFTPRTGGRRVEFRGQAGEVVDHIALEPIARKIYTGSATAVKTAVIDWAVAPLDTELRNIVAYLVERWELIVFDLAMMIDSHPMQVSRHLRSEIPRLTPEEQDRLALLQEINRLYDKLEQPIPIATWLRGDHCMRAYPGMQPLHQLMSSGQEAAVRMRDAFFALSQSEARVVLEAEFDAILDGPL